MKTDLIAIGNSRGIRIPKILIEQCGLRKTVEIRVENGQLIISPERKPRQGWSEAFEAADKPANDELLLESVGPNLFDLEEWEW